MFDLMYPWGSAPGVFYAKYFQILTFFNTFYLEDIRILVYLYTVIKSKTTMTTKTQILVNTARAAGFPEIVIADAVKNNTLELLLNLK